MQPPPPPPPPKRRRIDPDGGSNNNDNPVYNYDHQSPNRNRRKPSDQMMAGHDWSRLPTQQSTRNIRVIDIEDENRSRRQNSFEEFDLPVEVPWDKARILATMEDGVIESNEDPDNLFIVHSYSSTCRWVDMATCQCSCPANERSECCSHLAAVANRTQAMRVRLTMFMVLRKELKGSRHNQYNKNHRVRSLQVGELRKIATRIVSRYLVNFDTKKRKSNSVTRHRHHMVADEDCIITDERQPTTVGIELLRDVVEAFVSLLWRAVQDKNGLLPTINTRSTYINPNSDNEISKDVRKNKLMNKLSKIGNKILDSKNSKGDSLMVRWRMLFSELGSEFEPSFDLINILMLNSGTTSKQENKNSIESKVKKFLKISGIHPESNSVIQQLSDWLTPDSSLTATKHNPNLIPEIISAISDRRHYHSSYITLLADVSRQFSVPFIAEMLADEFIKHPVLKSITRISPDINNDNNSHVFWGNLGKRFVSALNIESVNKTIIEEIENEFNLWLVWIDDGIHSEDPMNMKFMTEAAKSIKIVPNKDTNNNNDFIALNLLKTFNGCQRKIKTRNEYKKEVIEIINKIPLASSMLPIIQWNVNYQTVLGDFSSFIDEVSFQFPHFIIIEIQLNKFIKLRNVNNVNDIHKFIVANQFLDAFTGCLFLIGQNTSMKSEVDQALKETSEITSISFKDFEQSLSGVIPILGEAKKWFVKQLGVKEYNKNMDELVMNINENINKNLVMNRKDSNNNVVCDNKNDYDIVRPLSDSRDHRSWDTPMSDLVHAESVLEQIRREEFGVGLPMGDEVMERTMEKQRSRLRRAVTRLAKDLYSDKSHLLLELIQNADDNRYSTAVIPTLELIVGNEGLCVINNELGFSDEDVRSLCDICKSSKSTTSDLTNRRIGRFGVGFKSVFRLSSSPHIFSGGYRFMFDENDSIGFVLPHILNDGDWNYYCPASISNAVKASNVSPNTLIWLPYRQSIDDSVISDAIRSVNSDWLHFLNRLQQIVIVDLQRNRRIHIQRRFYSTDLPFHNLPIQSLLSMNSNIQLISQRITDTDLTSLESETRELYYLHCSSLDLPSVVVAFPLSVKSETENFITPDLSHDVQSIFAYLPVRSVGFKFLVQADFHLAASREEILKGNEHNRCILDLLGRLVATSLLTLSDALGFSMLKFVPSPSEVVGDFKSVARSVRTCISQHRFVPTWGGSCSRIDEVVLPPWAGSYTSTFNQNPVALRKIFQSTWSEFDAFVKLHSEASVSSPSMRDLVADNFISDLGVDACIQLGFIMIEPWDIVDRLLLISNVYNFHQSGDTNSLLSSYSFLLSSLFVILDLIAEHSNHSISDLVLKSIRSIPLFPLATSAALVSSSSLWYWNDDDSSFLSCHKSLMNLTSAVAPFVHPQLFQFKSTELQESVRFRRVLQWLNIQPVNMDGILTQVVYPNLQSPVSVSDENLIDYMLFWAISSNGKPIDTKCCTPTAVTDSLDKERISLMANGFLTTKGGEALKKTSRLILSLVGDNTIEDFQYMGYLNRRQIISSQYEIKAKEYGINWDDFINQFIPGIFMGSENVRYRLKRDSNIMDIELLDYPKYWNTHLIDEVKNMLLEDVSIKRFKDRITPNELVDTSDMTSVDIIYEVEQDQVNVDLIIVIRLMMVMIKDGKNIRKKLTTLQRYVLQQLLQIFKSLSEIPEVVVKDSRQSSITVHWLCYIRNTSWLLTATNYEIKKKGEPENDEIKDKKKGEPENDEINNELCSPSSCLFPSEELTLIVNPTQKFVSSSIIEDEPDSVMLLSNWLLIHRDLNLDEILECLFSVVANIQSTHDEETLFLHFRRYLLLIQKMSKMDAFKSDIQKRLMNSTCHWIVVPKYNTNKITVESYRCSDVFQSPSRSWLQPFSSLHSITDIVNCLSKFSFGSESVLECLPTFFCDILQVPHSPTDAQYLREFIHLTTQSTVDVTDKSIVKQILGILYELHSTDLLSWISDTSFTNETSSVVKLIDIQFIPMSSFSVKLVSLRSCLDISLLICLSDYDRSIRSSIPMSANLWFCHSSHDIGYDNLDLCNWWDNFLINSLHAVQLSSISRFVIPSNLHFEIDDSLFDVWIRIKSKLQSIIRWVVCPLIFRFFAYSHVDQLLKFLSVSPFIFSTVLSNLRLGISSKIQRIWRIVQSGGCEIVTCPRDVPNGIDVFPINRLENTDAIVVIDSSNSLTTDRLIELLIKEMFPEAWYYTEFRDLFNTIICCNSNAQSKPSAGFAFDTKIEKILTSIAKIPPIDKIPSVIPYQKDIREWFSKLIESDNGLENRLDNTDDIEEIGQNRRIPETVDDKLWSDDVYVTNPLSPEIAQSIGRMGEEFTHNYLLLEYSDKISRGETKIIWVNQLAESGLPYDFRIELKMNGESITEYIETKATRTKGKTYFEVSYNEWSFAQREGDNYQIWRVFDVGSLNPTILRIRNPYRQWKLQRAKMCLALGTH